jgi:hypothetical protein
VRRSTIEELIGRDFDLQELHINLITSPARRRDRRRTDPELEHLIAQGDTQNGHESQQEEARPQGKYR